MTKFPLPWYKGGLFLAVAFILAVLLVKPIGVSTQFVIANGIIWDVANPDIVIQDEASESGYSSPNAYLNKSGGSYAANIANPLNYSFIFVIAMMAGAFLSSILKGGDRPSDPAEKEMPHIWREYFGSSVYKRYAAVFIAGIFVLFGARLAGGCTSGHMMSGMMQTSLSGFLFAIGAFAAAIPVALIIFRKK